MKHIAFIDSGIQCVLYKSINIKTNVDAKTVEKILNAVSERFEISVIQHNKNVDSTDKFHSLEEAIDLIKNSRITYTTTVTKSVENYDKIEDGVLTYDKFKKNKIVIKDSVAYYVTTKFEQCKREYTIPNTKNNDDIIVKEL